jgi:hypothetical protein
MSAPRHPVTGRFTGRGTANIPARDPRGIPPSVKEKSGERPQTNEQAGGSISRPGGNADSRAGGTRRVTDRPGGARRVA